MESLPTDTQPGLSSRRHLFKVTLVSLFLVVIGVGMVLCLREGQPLAPAVEPLPNGIPAPKSSWLLRCIPGTWGWFWRLKEFVFGRARPVTLQSALFDCAGISPSALSDLSLGKPQYSDTNGIQAWVLRDEELSSFRRRLEGTPALLASRANIITADGIKAGLFTGGPASAGLTMDFLPRIRRGFLDVQAVIIFSEAVTNMLSAKEVSGNTAPVFTRTNLAFAARIQLPKNTGLFLLNTNHADAGAPRIGVILKTQFVELARAKR